MVRGILFILLLVFAEVYAFKGLRVMSVSLDPMLRKVISWTFWLTTIMAYGSFFYMISRRSELAEYKSYGFFNFAVGFFLIALVTKLLFASFHLLDDITQLIRFAVHRFNTPPQAEAHEKLNRVQFFNQIGLVASAAVFGSMLYGVTRGKYAFRVLQEKLTFNDLPEAFDGLRIVQISDMHIGSFNYDFEDVQQGFDMINSLEPDYIFFTGDLVNNFADEAEPWIDRLAGLKARYGKYSILGNHDYGDYALSQFPARKELNFRRLVEIHEEAGFRLLRNENVKLEKNGQSISLLGTENWGLGFHQYGDLEKTMNGVSEDAFKIMLSHDPTFWEEHIKGKNNVHLTMSGHTHGAQFGVELPTLGIKFSPVSLRYKRWGGLYTEAGQHLYINRGFGFLAFPGRVGMPPEITLIELKRG